MLEVQRDYVLLAIDQAASSGWSLEVAGEHASSGTAITLVDMRDVIDQTSTAMTLTGLPLVVLF
jgi:hypothetical protein